MKINPSLHSEILIEKKMMKNLQESIGGHCIQMTLGIVTEFEFGKKLFKFCSFYYSRLFLG